MATISCEEQARNALGQTFGELSIWEKALIQEYCRIGLPGLLAADAISHERSKRNFIESIIQKFGRALSDDELIEALRIFIETDLSADKAVECLRLKFTTPQPNNTGKSAYRY